MGFLPAILVESLSALWALDDVGGQAHQLARPDAITTEWARLRQIEVGRSFEPRRHHPVFPSAVRSLASMLAASNCFDTET